ncbi:putative bifunctional diguanylate cyclase/phosphodiesterase [Devosia nitrariae]|uniref:EAL domain-containing protein n=1 Tax=Devosia nitrariae TaxID=2071872 RepID=A0ABQ5W2J0_9HYPH|nr:EAL domain-containing protein [Devosia nitrariae]GLQ54048.1 hypothetical protein GCM10010862_13070 [Devosia nitrariae]
MAVWRTAGSQIARTAVVALVIAAVAAGANFGLFAPLDQALAQFRFAGNSRPPSGEVLFVEIDAASLEAIGVWPWPRRVHGEVLDALMEMGAAEVVFDIDFSTASNSADDALFEAALARAGGYAFLAAFQQFLADGTLIVNEPLKRFARHASAVSVNVDGDGTGLTRSIPTVLAGPDLPSIPLALVPTFGGEGARIFIDYSIDLMQVPRIPVHRLLAGAVDPSLVAGRQVVIGAGAIELRDFFRVPRFGVLPGPLVQIGAVETAKAGRNLSVPGAWPALALAGVAGLLYLAFGARLSLGRLAMVAVAASLAIELAAWAALGQAALLVETLPFHATAGALVLLALFEERARRWFESREQQARLAWLAEHDVVSGARSRHAFLADLDRQLAVEPAASLMLVHLGRLEAVNASLGHEVADAVAAQVVKRLGSLFKILPARIGGDVFALNLPSGLDDAHRSLLPARLRVMLGQPFEVAGHQVVISPTCGFSETSPGTPVGAAELLRQAEVALTTARQRHTGSAVFAPAQAQRIADRRRLDLALRRALDENQFHLLFQPQMDLKSGAMVGVEALVRWQSPELGLVSPADFIPVAEETGVIVALGDWVMREACRQAAEWASTVNISVNVSSIQFRLGNVVGTVKRALAESGLAPERLDIEITESVFIDNDETMRGTLESLRALGVTIALDDFGTGYSSLSYLSKLPVDRIKIDQAFIRTLPDPHNEAIVESIVLMARRLEKTVVAEGVETEEQRAYLAGIGVELVQGYLFGRPGLPEAIGLVERAERSTIAVSA